MCAHASMYMFERGVSCGRPCQLDMLHMHRYRCIITPRVHTPHIEVCLCLLVSACVSACVCLCLLVSACESVCVKERQRVFAYV